LSPDPDPQFLQVVIETAQGAALEAGALLLDGFGQAKSVRYKGEIDPVTQFDLASEKLIVQRISTAFPDHFILAEESGETGVASTHVWYIDPLDGTVNFAHGFPIFCVSIAYEARRPDGAEIMAGVVFDPVRDEMFRAVRGQGAFLNDSPLAVTDRTDLGRALVATGFPYSIRQKPDPVLSRFRRMCLAAQGVRRPGAAALDLAWLAAGRLDGFWEEELHPWDTAAGILIVEEAGGRVSDFRGRPFRPDLKEILATNGHLHYTMSRILCEDPPNREEEALFGGGNLDEKNPDQ